MIQDIAPHQYFNEYKPTEPRQGDAIFFYEKGDTLLDKETGQPFLWEQVCMFLKDVPLTYYFRIDEQCFFAASVVPEEVKNRTITTSWTAFRTMQPEWMAFACITAHQLHGWYEAHQFCGKCGHRTQHDQVERAVRCPNCDHLVYPTISPAVIVGVTHGNRLLLTKYSRPGSYRNYALIAGFAEIGESLEATVRREVMEEVGLPVKNIRFYKSQPWSFSSSLLAGFYCDLDTEDETVTLQEDELGEGTWFEREELPVGGSSISLTREMIEQFRKGLV